MNRKCKLETVLPLAAPVLETTTRGPCPTGYTCVEVSCGQTYCEEEEDAFTCPSGFVNTGTSCVYPTISPTPWFTGRPCDFSIYVGDSWGLERGSGDCYLPNPNWQIRTIDGVTGYDTGGIGFGNIMIPPGPVCPDVAWWFRNETEICRSESPICWYQQVLWFLVYPQIPQSTIIRTPGTEGDNPPPVPPEISEISLFPPLTINQFYTMGECE